jgi:hypothetical protein
MRPLNRGRGLFVRIYDSELVVDRLHQILPHAEVFLSGLDRGVAEQHLDLLQVPARLPTQASARSASIVRGEILHADSLRISLHQPPHRHFRQCLTLQFPAFRDRAEDPPLGDLGGREPLVAL